MKGSSSSISEKGDEGKSEISPLVKAPYQLRVSQRISDDTESPYTLTIASHGPFTRLPHSPQESIFLIATSLLIILSIIAPYLLTGWHQRQATNTQANFVLHWLILGQIYGLSIAEFERYTARAYAY